MMVTCSSGTTTASTRRRAADAARFPAPDTGAEVGIDLGLTSFAVLSDGTVVRSPRFLRRAERKLRRLHKSLSRKAAGSSNKEKARVRVARAHAKVADSRRDFHHKTSTAIIRDNQAVYAEDLWWPGSPGPRWPSQSTTRGGRRS